MLDELAEDLPKQPVQKQFPSALSGGSAANRAQRRWGGLSGGKAAKRLRFKSPPVRSYRPPGYYARRRRLFTPSGG